MPCVAAQLYTVVPQAALRTTRSVSRSAASSLCRRAMGFAQGALIPRDARRGVSGGTTLRRGGSATSIVMPSASVSPEVRGRASHPLPLKHPSAAPRVAGGDGTPGCPWATLRLSHLGCGIQPPRSASTVVVAHAMSHSISGSSFIRRRGAWVETGTHQPPRLQRHSIPSAASASPTALRPTVPDAVPATCWRSSFPRCAFGCQMGSQSRRTRAGLPTGQQGGDGNGRPIQT